MFKAAGRGSTKEIGDDAESLAPGNLQRQSLTLVQRNYRVAGGPPHARGAEIDLILRDRDGTLVFVEVRARRCRPRRRAGQRRRHQAAAHRARCAALPAAAARAASLPPRRGGARRRSDQLGQGSLRC
jgi:putative endonuclease